MIRGVVIIFVILFLKGCGGPGNNGEQKEEASDSTPNIVLIISDDQAWPDYSFMGHPHIETSNIDHLASEGLTFTRGYLAAPVCRPSLASIATGLYPHQHGITGNDPQFPAEVEEPQSREKWLQKRARFNDSIIKKFKQHPTIPNLLKEQGYISFQTGKWWEGSWKDGGFTDGMTHGNPQRGGRHGDEGLDVGREGMQPIFNFIDRAQNQNSPFFLWYAPFLPHTPHNPPDSLLEKYLPKAPGKPVAQYWAMIDWFDITVGKLLNKLDQEGLSKNTLVIFVSDNGWIQDPEKKNRFMPGSKLSHYDMGIRTPIIYKWPGHIAPRMDTTTLVSSIDIAPTVLKAAGLEPTYEMQGINVMDSQEVHQRSAVFSESFTHDIADVDHPAKSLKYRTVIKGNWKLNIPSPIDTRELEYRPEYGGEKQLELFNIVNDPYEKQNVASDHPKKVKALRQKINGWWKPEF